MKTLNKSSQPLQMGIDKLWSRQEKPGAHVPGEEYTHRKLRGRSAMNIFPKCLKTLCLSLALVCAVGLTACNGTEESEEPACGDGIVSPNAARSATMVRTMVTTARVWPTAHSQANAPLTRQSPALTSNAASFKSSMPAA